MFLIAVSSLIGCALKGNMKQDIGLRLMEFRFFFFGVLVLALALSAPCILYLRPTSPTTHRCLYSGAYDDRTMYGY